MRVAVATLARGRALHLERQALAVARMRPAPTDYVVLALDEDRPDPRGATVVHRPLPQGAAIRLGAARNEVIAAAARRSDLVVCLDVDCLPAPNLLRGLVAAAAATRGRDLLAGPVGRLAPIPRRRLAPTPDRAAPCARGDVDMAPDRWLHPDTWYGSRGWSCSGRSPSR